MKLLAKILNEETKQVDVADSRQKEHFEKIGFSEQEVEQSYNGSWYLIGYAPIQPLDDIKLIKKQEINKAREQARLNEGAEYDNDLFDIDERSQTNITAIVSMLLANNVPEQFVSIYRSKTNVDHKLNKLQMIELGTAIGAKVSEIYQKSWDLKEQIDKADTVEEVEQITWS